MKGLTRQIHADVKKRRSSFLVALLFAAGDLRRWKEWAHDALHLYSAPKLAVAL